LLGGISLIDDADFECQECIKGKMHRDKIPKMTTRKASKVGDVIHTDVWGPSQIESINGSRYFATFTDEYIRYTTVIGLQKKSDVCQAFVDYHAMFTTQPN
jgi:hypothetical protein